jgi:hypothetical protein
MAPTPGPLEAEYQRSEVFPATEVLTALVVIKPIWPKRFTTPVAVEQASKGMEFVTCIHQQTTTDNGLVVASRVS